MMKVSTTFHSCLNPVKGLYLGTIHDAFKLDPSLFTAYVCIGIDRKRFGYPPRHPKKEFFVRVTDDPRNTRKFKKQLTRCVAFIKRCLETFNGSVLVYSQAGTFRWTAAIGAAYLICAHDYGVEYTEYALRFMFDEDFRMLLMRFKFKCFKAWIDSV